MQTSNFETFMDRLATIEREKNDYVVPAGKLSMVDPTTVHVDTLSNFSLNPVAHSQLAAKLDIPKKYYDRIQTIDGLREHNVNTLLQNNESNYTLRTVGGTARAFLSDRYLPVDNYMVLNEVMPVFKQFPDVQITSSVLTDKRMYMQVVFPHTRKDITVGDPVQYGLTLTNSEVGLGAIKVESTIWRLVCQNGMIGKSIVNRKHVGRRITEDDNMEMFRKETVQTDLKAFVMKLVDIIQYSLQEAQLEAMYAPMRLASGIQVAEPEAVIENITKRYNLNGVESQHVLRNMLAENNWTKYGIANGITNVAHVIDIPDRQYELEKIGNEVLNTTPAQWELLVA